MRKKLILASLVMATWGVPLLAVEPPAIPSHGREVAPVLAATEHDATSRTGEEATIIKDREMESTPPSSHPRGRAGTLGEGLSFMVIGMSVTFLFLMTLVVCMHGLHRFLVFFDRFFPEITASLSPSRPAESTSDHVALAIAVARAQRKE